MASVTQRLLKRASRLPRPSRASCAHARAPSRALRSAQGPELHGGYKNADIDLSRAISVTFVTRNGEEVHVKAPEGFSVLDVAHANDIDLEGACEGSLACSTCHVYVDENSYAKLDEPCDDENDMLDLAFALGEYSRLGCQVCATQMVDGMRVTLPPATRNMAVDGFVPQPH